MSPEFCLSFFYEDRFQVGFFSILFSKENRTVYKKVTKMYFFRSDLFLDYGKIESDDEYGETIIERRFNVEVSRNSLEDKMVVGFVIK